MRKVCSIFFLLCFPALVLSGSVAIAVQDILETRYDEAEPLPYASIAVFSVALPGATRPEPTVYVVPLLRHGFLRRNGAQRLEQGGLPHRSCDPLIILGHKLRC